MCPLDLIGERFVFVLFGQVDQVREFKPLHFAVELNFAGMPDGADDRYFCRSDNSQLGQLGTKLDLKNVDDLGLVDHWLGIDARIDINQPSGIWTFPVQTVSQSEGGFELVHQSVVVMPHWQIVGDAEGRWSATIKLAITAPSTSEDSSELHASALSNT